MKFSSSILAIPILTATILSCSKDDNGSPASPVPGAITGTVLSRATGSPIANAFVYTAPQTAKDTTDSAGFYLLSNVPAGTYLIIAAAQDFTVDSSSVAVTPGSTVAKHITLASLVGSINGTVTSIENGAYIAGAIVSTAPSIGIDTTNAAGRFSFQRVPLGTYTLIVRAQGFLLDSSEVTINSEVPIVANVSLRSQTMFLFLPLDGNANDLSGNENHGTMSGVVPTANRFGTPNTACWFSGDQSTISVPSTPSMHPVDQLTVAFWLRADSLTNNFSPIYHKGGLVQGSLANREYAAYVKATGSSTFQIQAFSAGDGGGQHEVLTDGANPLHQWIFVVAVFDRRNHLMQVYVNDVLKGQTSDSYSSFNTNDYPLTIGTEAEMTFPDHSPLRGAIDDFRLFNRALTSGEIHTLFTTP